MADALQNRHDIFPVRTVGNNVTTLDDPSPPKSDDEKEPLKEEQSTKKSKKSTPDREDKIAKCLSLIESMANKQMENEDRRLSVLERIAKSLEK